MIIQYSYVSNFLLNKGKWQSKTIWLHAILKTCVSHLKRLNKPFVKNCKEKIKRVCIFQFFQSVSITMLTYEYYSNTHMWVLFQYSNVSIIAILTIEYSNTHYWVFEYSLLSISILTIEYSNTHMRLLFQHSLMSM